MGRDYEGWRRLLAEEELPAALVDLDAVDHNVAAILRALSGSSATVRVASKSLRHPWLLRYVLERGGPAFRGLMVFCAAEAELLVRHGFDDLLMGYPVARAADARRLANLAAGGAKLVATVDDEAHVDLLERAAAEAGSALEVCLDLDMSWRPLGGRLHLGVRRSPLRDPTAALRVARRVEAAPHLTLVAVLAYEAQVAGMPDETPGDRLLDPVRRAIKARSRPVVSSRRRAVVEALQAAGHAIALVNGGGTGSVAFTGRDPVVTEVTAGSGFVCSHLFDHYRGLRLEPALFVALPIVRRSDPDFVTAAFGGYLASGAVGSDRAPRVHAPPGLAPTGLEGWGEVQTPFQVSAEAPTLAVGDPVIARPAKAGEPAERFAEYLLVRGERIEAREPTYRGLGFRGA
jgi:D-serine deaminase-like pyridoxal phosphate-dependent protein